MYRAVLPGRFKLCAPGFDGHNRTWSHSMTMCPSYRHGRAVPEAAVEGTCVQSVARHREVPK